MAWQARRLIRLLYKAEHVVIGSAGSDFIHDPFGSLDRSARADVIKGHVSGPVPPCDTPTSFYLFSHHHWAYQTNPRSLAGHLADLP
jgi:hypothetical protein